MRIETRKTYHFTYGVDSTYQVVAGFGGSVQKEGFYRFVLYTINSSRGPQNASLFPDRKLSVHEESRGRRSYVTRRKE